MTAERIAQLEQELEAVRANNRQLLEALTNVAPRIAAPAPGKSLVLVITNEIPPEPAPVVARVNRPTPPPASAAAAVGHPCECPPGAHPARSGNITINGPVGGGIATMDDTLSRVLNSRVFGELHDLTAARIARETRHGLRI